jgi:hypothetical protein
MRIRVNDLVFYPFVLIAVGFSLTALCAISPVLQMMGFVAMVVGVSTIRIVYELIRQDKRLRQLEQHLQNRR